MSALVVCFNNVDELAPSLDALLAQEVTGGLEVVVVDNASSDGTRDVLGKYADRVTLILRDSNVGYAEGNNEALAASCGELIALINPDCIVDPGCLRALADHLDARPGVGLAAALLRNTDGTPQLFARHELGVRGAFWAFTEMGSRFDRRFRGGRHAAARRYADQWPPSEPLAVDCPAAACTVLWRQLVHPRVFDPRLPLLFNDADLHRRLREKSYRLEVVPAATAQHGYGTSIRRVVRGRMRAERTASLRRYVARDWGMTRCAALWILLVLDGLFLFPPSLAGRKRGRERALLRGTLGGLGLPGGNRPWLLVIPGPGGRLRAILRRLRQHPRVLVVRWSRRRRRRTLIRRLRYQAWKHRVALTVHIDPTADLSRPVLELRPGSRVVLEIGPRSALREGVVLRLAGELIIGAGVDIRWGAVLNVKGRLVLEDRVVIGRGVSVHADGNQHWGFAAVAAEFATVLDTDHTFDGSPVAMFDQPVRLRELSIGPGAFLGAKVSVLPGASVGRGVRVGAGSVVTTPLPDHCVAFGAPAQARDGRAPRTSTTSRTTPRKAQP